MDNLGGNLQQKWGPGGMEFCYPDANGMKSDDGMFQEDNVYLSGGREFAAQLGVSEEELDRLYGPIPKQ